MTVNYRDNTPLSQSQKSSVSGLAGAIRTKMYGKDTREAMASALELLSTNQSDFSSTPKGVYATLDDLKKAFPQGDTGIYVISDNGHWYFYFYQDSEWVDGGVYQSVELSDLQKREVFQYVLDQDNLIKNGKGIYHDVNFAENNIGKVTYTKHHGHYWVNLSSDDDKTEFKGLNIYVPAIKGLVNPKYSFEALVRLNSSTGAKDSNVQILAQYYDKDGNWLKNVGLLTRDIGFNNNSKMKVDVPAPQDVGASNQYKINIIVVKPNAEPVNIEVTDMKLIEQPETYAAGNPNNNLFAQKAWHSGGNHGSTSILVEQDVQWEMVQDVTDEQHIATIDIPTTGNIGKILTLNGLQGHFYAKELLHSKYQLRVRYVAQGQVVQDEMLQTYEFNANEIKEIEFELKANAAVDTVKLSLIQLDKHSELNLYVTKPIVVARANAKSDRDIFKIKRNDTALYDGKVQQTTQYLQGKKYDVITFPTDKADYKGTLIYFNPYLLGLENHNLKVSFLVNNFNNVDATYAVDFNFRDKNKKNLIVRHFADIKAVAGQPQKYEVIIPTITGYDIDFSQAAVDDAEGGMLVIWDRKSDTATSIGLSDVAIKADYEYQQNGQSESPIVQGSAGLPTINLTGDFDSIDGDNSRIFQFDYVNGQQHLTGFTDTKWQGGSSQSFPAKNLKLKLFEDRELTKKMKIRPRADFPKTHKFNLKVNFVQPYQSRNLVNSMIAAEMASTRGYLPGGLWNAPMYGEIQGFPVNVIINGQYYALMSFNTAKGDSTWGLDDETTQFVLEGETHSDATRFAADTFEVGDGKDFTLEYPDDLTDQARFSMENALKFVNGSDDMAKDDFVTNFKNYFDPQSVIDWMILCELIQANDELDKNICWASYDGTRLVAVPYDIDSTWGLDWQPQTSQPSLSNLILPTQTSNKLIQAMLKYYGGDIKTRWNQLKALGTVTVPHLQRLFANYINTEIGMDNLEKHWDKWPTSAPVEGKTDYNELMRSIRIRVNACDSYFNSLK